MLQLLYRSSQHLRKALLGRGLVYVGACSFVFLAALIALIMSRPDLRQRQRDENAVTEARGRPAEVLTGSDDSRYFTMSLSFEFGETICHQGPQSIVAAASFPIVSPDSEMRRIGTCTDQALNLYTRQGEQNQPALYVKTDTYRYLAVRLETAEPSPRRATSTSGLISDR